MNIKILSKDKDPMGAAILDYQKSGRADSEVYARGRRRAVRRDPPAGDRGRKED